ncbi:MAG TPA: hypothetical protein DCR20_09525 [Planctomycetaceae bacterium]|jgi:hypothetical protein|nr:hypothetical protein [Planctomycetaceae bacterium]
MAQKSNIPRFKIGERVYRVEWKKDVPSLAEYTVKEVTTNAFKADNSSGKTEEFVGKTVLPLFATSVTEAVNLAFTSVAKMVVKEKGNVPRYFQMVVKLGKLK